MKLPLHQITDENIFTLLSFYELIKEKSEKCLLNISKFSKFTNSYHTNIKNIFIEDEDLINSENKSEINEKNSNNNFEDIFYEDIVMQNNKTVKKKIDISPLKRNISKINKLFNNYTDCIE